MFYKNKLKKMILWGATGQAVVLEEFVHKVGYRIVSVFDNDHELSSPFKHIPLYNGESEFIKWLEKNNSVDKYFFLIAIGGWKGTIRIQLQQFLESHGLIAATVIHPSAYVSRNAEIAKGCQILGNSFVGAGAVLGSQVIVNSSSSIDHECILSDGVHVAPGAVLAGCVKIGECSFVGTGSSILPRIVIGTNVIIGAGSVVTKSIPDNVIVYGNPAKIIRENKYM